MKDDDKTRNQLLSELAKLRQQLAELEKSESRHHLSEEEHLFKALVESSKEAIAISDPHGQLIYVNHAHEELFGRSLEEARRLNYRDYYQPESIEVLDRDVAPALARGESWEGILDAIDSKGGRFPLWERADTVRGAEGNMLYAFGIMHDVTEEVRVKESLRESEERFRLAFENANIGMCLVDTEGRLIKVNSQMCEIFGYSQEELEGMTVSDITHPEYLDVSPRFMRRASSEEITHAEFEKQYFHKEGHIVWGEVASSLARDVEGRPLYFISHVKDITERKQAEEELRKRTHDLGERIKELNCLYGISKLIERQDLQGGELFQAIVNLIPPAWQYPEITCARFILNSEEFRSENFRETIWVQTRFITVHGKHTGTFEVFYLEERPEAEEGPFLQEERNLLNAIAERLGRVLERKKAEEDLQDAYDLLEMKVKIRTAELAKANRELRNEIAERRRMEEALRNSSEKLKSFAYSIIHDLKSPSIGIYGLTERLYRHYRDVLDERGRSYCEQVLKASVHVAALIEKINLYIEAKESPLIIEEVKPKEILRIIRDEFSPRLMIRQIEWLEPDTVAVIKADKLCMIRMFRNFVDNALKYGGEALSEIRIGYKESDEFHTFSVSDDGAGISGGDYDKIFEMFRRDQTSGAVQGAGLGLTIVKEIAERHRGRVWAEPARKRGTTFYISVSKDL